MKPVRNSAKAVIIQDGRLLAIRCVSWKNETYHILPGGGQEPGETLHQALIRECHEELGAEVSVGPLLWVREYIAKNHEFAEKYPDFHQIEFMFDCTLISPLSALGHNPDAGQTGVDWLPLDSLEGSLLFPRTLAPLLAAGRRDGPVYLGDMN